MQVSNSTIAPFRRPSATLAAALAALLSGHAAAWAQTGDIPTHTIATTVDPWTINVQTKAGSQGPLNMTGVYSLTENGKIIDRKVMLPDGGSAGHNWLSAGTLVGKHTLMATYSGDCSYGSSSAPVTVDIPPARSSQRDGAKVNAAQGTRQARADRHSAKPRARPAVRAGGIASGTLITSSVNLKQSHIEAKVYFSDPVSSTDAGIVSFDADGNFLQSAQVNVSAQDGSGTAIILIPTSKLVGYSILRAQYFPGGQGIAGSTSCVKL